MIYQIRTVRTEATEDEEAVQWAVKVAAYLNETYPDMHVEVVRNISWPSFSVRSGPGKGSGW